jgi:carbon monoxide dehydrogenase subunit G
VTVVRSSVAIAAPPPAVWAVVMDPRRLREWVTIHRDLREYSADPPREGSTMEQVLHLRGADIHVSWLLVECREPHYARWEGRGPARSTAHIEYRLQAVDGGTLFDYQNEFRPPLGAVGALASAAVMGQAPQREADHSLAALRRLIERPPA